MPERPCHAGAPLPCQGGRDAPGPAKVFRPSPPAKPSSKSTTTTAIVVAFTRLIDHGTRRIVTRLGPALRTSRYRAILRLVLRTCRDGPALRLVLRAILRTLLNRTIVAGAIARIPVVGAVAIVMAAVVVAIGAVVTGRVITAPSAITRSISRPVSGTIIRIR